MFPYEEPFVSIALVGRARPPLWHWDTWSKVVLALAPLTSALSSKLSVRSTQGDPNSKDLKFGRLGWNEKSHKKWTHYSPDTLSLSSDWTFCYGDVFAPSSAVCFRERRAPDFFCSFDNPFIGTPRVGQFNQFFHISLPKCNAKLKSSLVAGVANEIASILDASHRLAMETPWAKSGFCVMSTINNCLHYLGFENDNVFDPSKTRAPRAQSAARSYKNSSARSCAALKLGCISKLQAPVGYFFWMQTSNGSSVTYHFCLARLLVFVLSIGRLLMAAFRINERQPIRVTRIALL